MLFAAEWGDASQIATAGLVARRGGVAHAVATGVGAWVALVAVAALAVVAGELVVERVPLRLVHRVAGVLFAVFAVLAAIARRRAWTICPGIRGEQLHRSVQTVRRLRGDLHQAPSGARLRA